MLRQRVGMTGGGKGRGDGDVAVRHLEGVGLTGDDLRQLEHFLAADSGDGLEGLAGSDLGDGDDNSLAAERGIRLDGDGGILGLGDGDAVGRGRGAS